jgi:hypothetical protein
VNVDMEEIRKEHALLILSQYTFFLDGVRKSCSCEHGKNLRISQGE